MSTGIEWTDETWNPVTGCDKVSPGCDHCYAETIAHRFDGTKAYPNGFKVTLRPERLDRPLRWTRPRMVFVNSMSDLFHKDIPDAYIGAVFEVMAQASDHTFQILTKRPGRMRSLLHRWATEGIETDGGYLRPPHRPLGTTRLTSPLWTPPPNVWLGISAEDQRWANVRVPLLLDTPAAVRFVSAEPLLGPVQFGHDLLGLDWVIVGGESGNGARTMDPDWVRTIRDDCETNDVAFFFKQWGGRSAKANGKTLDGREHTAWPERVTA